MSDPGEFDSNLGKRSAAADGTVSTNSRVAVGMGAVVGGLSTLAATLSLGDVLQDNPFVALAVFALLGAFLIFFIALTGPASRLWPVVLVAIALLCVGVAAGSAAAIKGPARVKLVVSATPSISDARPIKLGEYDVGWGSPTPMRAGGKLTLDLSGVETYYNAKEKAARGDCVEVLKLFGVKIGPGTPNASTESRGS